MEVVHQMEGRFDLMGESKRHESYPVQVAEFAISQGISEAPAFRWWVKDVL
jgi:hypothetical protein